MKSKKAEAEFEFEKRAKDFEEIVVWPLAMVGLKRAIYLTENNRMREIPKDYRQQMGILLSMKGGKR